MNALTTQFPVSGPADPPMPPPGCPHREWNAGRRSFGPAIPDFARGAYFPGDEPGARCELSGQTCDPHPAFCPLWRPSDIACPACLAFTRRRWPRSVFSQSLLLARPTDENQPLPPRPHGPGLYCPACDEEYADLAAVTLAALDRLRDLLDDLNFTQGSLEELREKTAAPPAAGETAASLARLRGLLDDLGLVQDSLEELRKKTTARNAGTPPSAGDAAHLPAAPHGAAPRGIEARRPAPLWAHQEKISVPVPGAQR